MDGWMHSFAATSTSTSSFAIFVLAASPVLRLNSSSRRFPRPPYASLGFNADPRLSIERAANNLLKDAAALLVYQDVLRIPPAQQFLQVLLALRRGDDGWKLLNAYGEFYKLMADGHFLSWEDLILDGILAGEGNPFAEAAANVGNPSNKWSGGVTSSLQAAAAADLDSLQRLSVTESTLVGWVMDLVPDIKPEWRIAAESTLGSRDVKQELCHSNISMQDGADPTSKNTGTPTRNLLPNNVTNDVLDISRERWRKQIGGLWRWSEAVPLLMDYYLHNGIGRLAFEQGLICKGGKLAPDHLFHRYGQACNFHIYSVQYEELRREFERHSSKYRPLHALVQGPSGSGKTWFVYATLHDLVVDGRLRAAYIPKKEIKHLSIVIEELAKNWQLRYVLVVEGDTMDETIDLPENIMLCMIKCTPTGKDSTVEKDFHESDAFGSVLTLTHLDIQSYLLCLEDLLMSEGRNNLSVTHRKSIMDQATSWAKARRTLCVRSAVQFFRSIEPLLGNEVHNC